MPEKKRKLSKERLNEMRQYNKEHPEQIKEASERWRLNNRKMWNKSQYKSRKKNQNTKFVNGRSALKTFLFPNEKNKDLFATIDSYADDRKNLYLNMKKFLEGEKYEKLDRNLPRYKDDIKYYRKVVSAYYFLSSDDERLNETLKEMIEKYEAGE